MADQMFKFMFLKHLDELPWVLKAKAAPQLLLLLSPDDPWSDDWIRLESCRRPVWLFPLEVWIDKIYADTMRTQRGMNDDDGKTIKRTRSWSGHALQLLLYRSKCFPFTWGLSAWRYILFVMEIWDMDLKEHWLFDLCIVKTWPCAARYYCNVVLSNRCTIWEDDQTMCACAALWDW